MSFNKIAIVSMMMFGATTLANAADVGKVTFFGTIVDAPCSVAAESLDQTVPLGFISKNALADKGESVPRPFTIQLEQCSFGDPAAKNNVSTTFNGVSSPVAGANELLAIQGATAAGAGVAITTYEGKRVVLGQATTPSLLVGETPALQYTAFLKGGDTDIKPGEFTAVTNFQLSYQ